MTEFSEKEFDVIGFGKSILSEVERVRSFRKVSDTETKEGFQLPVESRIDAFLRLIGLPYFVSVTDKKGVEKKDDIKFLNPGFGKTTRSGLADKKITNNFKQDYKDPNGTTGKIGTVVSRRKNDLATLTEGIGSSDMNIRMSKALCAPLDVIPNFPEKILTGEGDYTFTYPGSGVTDKRKVVKRLFPLVPNYDQVLPLSNELARPFSLSVSERRVDRDTVLRKPFIEQVVRIRFVVYGSAQKASELEGQKDFIKSIKQLVGENEFSKIFPTSDDSRIFTDANLVEQFIINKFLDAIKNLARRWVKINEQRINLLRKIRPTVNIKTSSARQSPFGKRIEVSTDLSNTSEGEKIKKLNKAISREEALIAILPTDETEEKEPNVSKTRNITPSALQNSFTELITYNLKKNKEVRSNLVARSKKNITTLERIRLELDVMTGEFTGLSLPDVVCTIAALFLMDRNKLLNLLDKYVVDFMKTDSVLKTIVKDVNPTSTNAMEAVQELEKRVDQLFTLFQKEVEAVQARKTQGRKNTSIRKSDDKEPSTPACYVSQGET